MEQNNPYNKKDLRFMRYWEKQREQRLKYAIINSLILSILITGVLAYMNDYAFPQDTVRLIVTFVVAMLINTLIQYFSNYKILEKRYQKLLEKKSGDDQNQ